jgi:hypothetical protein
VVPALRAGEKVPLNHWIHGKAPNDDGIVVRLHLDEHFTAIYTCTTLMPL